MRTRFPPSPTGLLHIGGLRTALYCYLTAKQANGTFVLRIEDTDRERYVEGAIENFLQCLHWGGILPDEGVVLKNGQVAQEGNKGPYIQSERLSIYGQYADQLIASGHAYYAFDTKEEIEQMRTDETARGNPSPKYDASVRLRMKNSLTMSEAEVKAWLDRGDPYVIRFKVDPTKTISCFDHIRGNLTFQGHTIDDQILMKSDGYPTYHLANIVDDHLMDIDYVLRGEEWLPSLPKHILLYEAFTWKLPEFAHVPLLLNHDKSKLSKRQNDVSVQDYIDHGYLPEAVINFVAFLGWNPGTTQELFSLEELVKEFTMERIQKAGAVFDRDKLDWMQGQWMRRFPVSEFSKRIRPLVAEKYPDSQSDNQFEQKAALIQERITFFKEAPDMLSYFYEEPAVDMNIILSEKQKVTADIVPTVVNDLHQTLSNVDEAQWTDEHLKEILFNMAEEKEYKRGQILWPLRALLTGLPFSPGAFEVAAVLGKQKTLERIERVQKAL